MISIMNDDYLQKDFANPLPGQRWVFIAYSELLLADNWQSFRLQFLMIYGQSHQKGCRIGRIHINVSR